ncbi:MAG: hypothetical protein WC269_02290 [Candidatus Gracilibacteria bacterium]|jgi:NhaP-type Na+/H+ or K+/H+ antiporter
MEKIFAQMKFENFVSSCWLCVGTIVVACLIALIGWSALEEAKKHKEKDKQTFVVFVVIAFIIFAIALGLVITGVWTACSAWPY